MRAMTTSKRQRLMQTYREMRGKQRRAPKMGVIHSFSAGDPTRDSFVKLHGVESSKANHPSNGRK